MSKKTMMARMITGVVALSATIIMMVIIIGAFVINTGKDISFKGGLGSSKSTSGEEASAAQAANRFPTFTDDDHFEYVVPVAAARHAYIVGERQYVDFYEYFQSLGATVRVVSDITDTSSKNYLYITKPNGDQIDIVTESANSARLYFWIEAKNPDGTEWDARFHDEAFDGVATAVCDYNIQLCMTEQAFAAITHMLETGAFGETNCPFAGTGIPHTESSQTIRQSGDSSLMASKAITHSDE